MYKHYRLIISLLIVIVLAGCADKNEFVVKGVIQHAAGQKLLLIRDGLLHSTVLDSCMLKSDGSYRFKAPRPEYPDFYRLQVNHSNILFAVDSCEHITINADARSMDSIYTVQGSMNSQKMESLQASLLQLQNEVNRVLKNRSQYSETALTTILDSLIQRHKKVAQAVILTNPLSTAAYYAVFQQLNGYMLFSPYNHDDRRYCAAVATAYHTFYPKYDRSVSLYNYVMQAIVADQRARNQELLNQMMQHAKSGTIDLNLPDRNGNMRKLSDLKGKVVLLDFVAYQDPNLSDYIFSLRDLYSKYHDKGLEIYQVDLDKDLNTWLSAVNNLPWICVRGNGNVALLYNVNEVPVNFLIDRDGNLIKRNATAEEIRKVIDNK
ncbi:MAG: thioredoxin-like domain-containing protein [Microbacter sp.]